MQSFRRDTHILIGNMIEKEKREDVVVPVLMSTIGTHIARTADTLSGLNRKVSGMTEGGMGILLMGTSVSTGRDRSTVSTSKQDSPRHRRQSATDMIHK